MICMQYASEIISKIIFGKIISVGTSTKAALKG